MHFRSSWNIAPSQKISKRFMHVSKLITFHQTSIYISGMHLRYRIKPWQIFNFIKFAKAEVLSLSLILGAKIAQESDVDALKTDQLCHANCCFNVWEYFSFLWSWVPKMARSALRHANLNKAWNTIRFMQNTGHHTCLWTEKWKIDRISRLFCIPIILGNRIAIIQLNLV